MVNPDSPKSEHSDDRVQGTMGARLATGIGSGVAIGMRIGAAMDNHALGIGIGIAPGAGLGAALGYGEKDDKAQ